ncbi:putative ribonuclease H-like domain-containing protein [Tanacetum coccineum]
MVSRTVLTRYGPIIVNTARPVNTVQPRTTVNNVGPMKNVINNAYSIARRPFNKITTANNSNFNKRVNSVNDKNVNAARPNVVVNTARLKAVLSVVKGNKGNVFKASACWVWRPKHKVLDHVSKNNSNPQQDLKDKGVIDSGCSRHMTGNRSYLTDYKEIDGGFVAFGGNSKGGKITKKGKIRTGKLDFEDVYFVKELKFNLFNVSQMCDKKNSVLFTDTTCVVLSPDFKLTDESHVLLKVPRKDNMYSVDLKNIVPQGVLTCLFAKATPDESNFWHKRLGHVNFKTMNKLVKVNLVRGLPSKLFEINQTCVACQKGKQYRTSCRKPALSFMRPFGCPVTILNTIDHLGKFDGKADEGFFVGYSTNSKAFRVFNSRTRIVEENLHVQFSENTSNIAGSRPNWLFDIDALTNSMNYKPVVVRNQSNGNAGTKACNDAGKARMETDSPDAGFKPSGEEEKKDAEDPGNESGNPTKGKDSEVPSTEEPRINQEKVDNINSTNNINTASDGNSTNNVNTVSSTVNAAGIVDNVVAENIVYECVDDPNMPELEEIGRFSDAEDDISGADMNNLDTYFQVSPVPTTRIHKDHPIEQIIGDLNLAPQTRRMTRNLEEHGFLSTTLEQRRNHKDIQNCLFACFLSQEEPKKVVQALKDPSWIEAMQEELLQFKLQEVWTLVELPNGKRAIRTKWVFRNKKDERGIVIKNKVRLVTQGYTQEEGIDYDEVFAPVARIKAIRLFLAYASFKDFVVYQMDVKSAFLYGKIEEEVYVCHPPSFEDPDFSDKRGKIDKTLFIKRDKSDILLVQVYVDDIIFGSTRKKMCTEFEKMMHKKFQMSSMGELTFFLGLQVKQKEDGIFISQDKYVNEILNKFGFSDVKTARTPMETQKALLKDADGEDVDEHLYRSMIGSLMYLTSSRHDIMFAVCADVRFQVNPIVSHLYAVKRICRYLKGQPKLCLWYPKDSPFDLVAYTDNDYAGASLDRKSTTGGCQFLGCRLISWQCKKKTVVANSITEAEYIAASNCCGQATVGSVNDVRLNLVLLVQVNAVEGDFINTSIEVAALKFASSIKYALTVNPTIYCSCVKQFWDTVKAKTVNKEVQLQALMDKKKVIITESTIRRDLQLEDANGVDCLPNAAIFEQLTLMRYEKLSQKLTFYKAFFFPQLKFLIHTILQRLSAKTTAWNEFSSTMAFAIICLATNQKFNFSKYIFDNMVKNVDSMVKFWMYPRFIQVFVNKQVGHMSHHKRIYVTPSHTKKIFGNMKKEGKGFSGRVTPLFQTIMVQAHEEMGEGLEIPIDPYHTPIITPPPSSFQPQMEAKI